MDREILITLQSILSKASGIRGSKFLAAGATETGKFSSVVVNTDLVIAAITSDDADMQTFVGPTLSAGAIITVQDGKSITSITSTSGDAILYK